MPEVEVAIIGAGPVGLTLANMLGRRGRRVAVLEREAEGYSLPRAVVLDDEVMRVFQNLGLEAELRDITEVGTDAQFVDGAGKVLVHWERPVEITPNGWYVNYRFHQPRLEAVLRRGLGRFEGAEVHWHHEVTGLTEGDDEVVVTCTNGAEFRAAYVVGCDGGRSFTRDWIGGGSEDLGFHEDWLIVDLLLHVPEADPDRRTTHYCGTPRMGSNVFVGSARKRWEFRLNPEDDRATVGEPETAWKILAPWITPDAAAIERTAVYTFHSLIARNWRRGRVLIAGDAAHQTPPFMGQGMCAGIRDCANLGWKLDLALSGGIGRLGPEDLLQSYRSERLPHVREFIELTINLGRMINQTAERLTTGEPLDRQDGSQTIRLIRPRLGRGLAAGEGPRRGELFPQIALPDGRRLDDAVGPGFSLVTATPVPPEAEAPFREAGIAVIAAPEAAAALRGHAAMLVRPDRAILGACRTGRTGDLLPENWTRQ